MKPQPQSSSNNQSLHDEGGAEPGHGVLQRDQPHEVVPELRVVPGAGVELAQQEARAELPQVRPERVYEAAQQDGAAVSQPEVHALHDEDARAVDEERPHAGHTRELPVVVDDELPGRGEHDLAEVAVDGVEVPAGQGGERDRGRGGVHDNHLDPCGSGGSHGRGAKWRSLPASLGASGVLSAAKPGLSRITPAWICGFSRSLLVLLPVAG